KRFPTPFTPKVAATQSAALALVLSERRKELPFTSQIRWEDIRRLSKDPATAITLQRTINGQTITLQPGDSRYVFPIPENEILLSGIQQNPR
ncbi:MAG: RagB/SusD family nutrient uptake outer membrane protein, partial [Sediminibacterium sp.]